MTDFPTLRSAMVDTQVRPSDVTRFQVINAMLTVRREMFVPTDQRDVAYAGMAIDLGNGRIVPDPRILAKMLDGLDIGPGDLVLDVGCGLGYSTAVIAQMAEAVIGLEEDETLAAEAEANLTTESVDNAVVVQGRLAEGAPQHGPYDVICINGAVEFVPDTILDQLKDGGRIAAIFVDGVVGHCRIGAKAEGHVAWRTAFDATAPVLPGFARTPEFVF